MFGARKPTDEEVLRISDVHFDFLKNNSATRLLSEISAFASANIAQTPDANFWMQRATSHLTYIGDQEALLTRTERRMLAGAESFVEDLGDNVSYVDSPSSRQALSFFFAPALYRYRSGRRLAKAPFHCPSPPSRHRSLDSLPEDSAIGMEGRQLIFEQVSQGERDEYAP